MIWESKYKNKIENYLKELLKHTSDRGLSIEDTVILFQREVISLSENLTDSELIKGLIKIKKNEDFSMEQFENIIDNLRKTPKGEVKTWKIYIPYDLSITKRKITINGIVFKKYSAKSVRKEINVQFTRSFSGNIYDRFGGNYIKGNVFVTEARGIEFYSAWHSIHPTFILFRGIVDFTAKYAKWTYSTTDRNRTKLGHPEIVLGKSDKSNDFLRFHLPKQNSRTKQLNFINQQRNDFYSLINFFENIENDKSAKYLLADCFRLYGQAMDEVSDRGCFLCFWQLAERITLSGPGKASTESVKKRLIYFANYFYKVDISATINELAIKRNNYVHRGIWDFNDDDINILKSLCEDIIIWLFENNKSVPTIGHLESFYRYRTENEYSLKITKEILKFINNKRR